MIHQIPVFALIITLILAWRWEWIGAALFGVAGLLYVALVLFMQHHFPPAAGPIVILTISGPAFIIAWLFLANWRRHNELRDRGN